MTDIESLCESISSRYLTAERIKENGVPFSRYIIWGAGLKGELIKEVFEKLGAQAVCFVDNNPTKHDTTFCDLPVYSLNSVLKKHPRLPLFIASNQHEIIMRQLMKAGVTDTYAMPLASFYYYPLLLENYSNQIEEVFAWLADDESRAVYASLIKAYLEGDDGCFRISEYPQYFHPEVMPEANDVVVDGGAYNGDTCIDFSEKTDCSHIVCFEPCEDTFVDLCECAKGVRSEVTCINKGLWSCEETLSFSTFEVPANNRIVDQGEVSIAATPLDKVVNDLELDKVDLIKMDVEGAELEALKGAQSTIKKYKPKLQICLYHSLEDMWTIPQYIKSLDPSYVFFVGHHEVNPSEVVLYAR